VSWGQRTEVIVHYSEGPTTQSVRSIQDFHLNGRGWSDIGYNFLVDTTGRIYEGRGWLVVGAHAPDHNTSGIGVCMIGRDGDATPAAKRAIRAVYDEACRRTGRTLAKRGHRDVYATSCPGNELHAWVRAGMPVDGAATAPEIEEDDDMPVYVSVGVDKPQDLPPNKWVTVEWGEEYSDQEHHHWNKGGSSFVVGPARYGFTANVRIDGLTPGTELQARAIEHPEGAGDVQGGPISEYTASEGATFAHYSLAADTVGKGYRVRFQVIHYGTQVARITSGSAKAFVWPTG
jgi:hypothetical protein